MNPQPTKEKKGNAPLGCTLATFGIVGTAIGGGLSVTLLGAIIGIPIMIICVPILLYGSVLFGRAFRK